jgi:hypothetical protein
VLAVVETVEQGCDSIDRAIEQLPAS